MNIIQFLGRGVNHEENGLPCQDYAQYCYAPNGSVIMVLSDGCSSAKYAEQAARVNVESVIDVFSRQKLPEFVANRSCREQLLTTIRGNLEKIAPAEYRADPAQFSATLVFAVADKDNVLIGHIGDGNALCCDRNGAVTCFSEEDNGGASDRTFFTVSDAALPHFRLQLIPAGQVENMILYSDGPQKMMYYLGDKITQNAASAILTEVHKGLIKDCTSLADRLAELTNDALFQLMDDWSVLIFDRSQRQCDDLSLKPVSMRARFMEHFYAEKGRETGVQ